VFASASEGFSRQNIKASIAESLARFAPVSEAAKRDGIRLRGYVSCVVACPYDGPIAPAAVAEVVAALAALGSAEISLGDTIGRGTPASIEAMLSAVLEVLPPDRLAGHFHDTNGRALESVMVAWERGVRVFDAAVGGLGGCPFAPGATGNLATGALVDWAAARGIATGIDRDRLATAEIMARAMRGDRHDGDAPAHSP
ncbi:MAG: hydroxymethylglutaryl-CoA lyase, partial [Pseudomonadota bacterium]